MTLHNLIQRTEKVVVDNSPAIMTALGVAGTLTTAWLVGTATFRAAELIEDERKQYEENSEEFELRDKVELVWKLYVPALSVAAITCTAIIMSNRVSTRRATAVATAFTLSERAHDEYRARVIEKLGDTKEKQIQTELAQDRVRRAGPTSVVVADGAGKVLCHDGFSNQFFTSDMETIRSAVNDINAQILHADSATVNDFYDAIRVDNIANSAPDYTTISSEMGWNNDRLLEVSYDSVLKDEKIPCLSIVFATVPVRDPWRYV